VNPPHPDADEISEADPDDSDDISEAVEAVEDVEDVNLPHPDDIVYDAIVHSEDSVDIFNIF